MTASRGNTSSRGYGAEHQAERRRRIESMRDGDPCCRCGRAMYRAHAARLDLDHTEDRRGYRGLAHRRCNRQAGARVGNQSWRRKVSGFTASTPWHSQSWRGSS